MKHDLYKILKTLRKHERGITPDPAWIRTNRERLLMQVKNSMPTELAAEKNFAFVNTLRSRIVRFVRGPVLAVAMVVAILLGGSLASVSAAEQSLPGDSLYTLKLVTEQARLVLTSESSKRMKLKAEFTKRRVEELRTILAEPEGVKKGERAQKAAEILKQDLNTLKEQLAEATKEGVDRDTAEVAKSIDKDVVEVVTALSEAKKDLPDDMKKSVSDAQAEAADVGMKTLSVMVDASKSNDESVSSEEIDASITAHASVAQQVVESTRIVTAGQDVSGTTSTSVLANEAEATLEEVRQYLRENRLEDAVQKIREASLKSFMAQRVAEEEQVLQIGSASSSPAVEVPNESADSDSESSSSTDMNSPETDSTE